jgi:hypothetical protein
VFIVSGLVSLLAVFFLPARLSLLSAMAVSLLVVQLIGKTERSHGKS